MLCFFHTLYFVLETFHYNFCIGVGIEGLIRSFFVTHASAVCTSIRSASNLLSTKVGTLLASIVSKCVLEICGNVYRGGGKRQQGGGGRSPHGRRSALVSVKDHLVIRRRHPWGGGSERGDTGRNTGNAETRQANAT